MDRKTKLFYLTKASIANYYAIKNYTDPVGKILWGIAHTTREFVEHSCNGAEYDELALEAAMLTAGKVDAAKEFTLDMAEELNHELVRQGTQSLPERAKDLFQQFEDDESDIARLVRRMTKDIMEGDDE